jgi:RNA polymerase sigma-70 factor (ECF subfamily)
MTRRPATSSTLSSSPIPDDELVERCRTGDTAAWRGLYDRYSPSVHRFISALGIPVEEREDAAQDVFVAVYRSLARFRGEAQLSTWIYRIAARHAVRLGRRRRVREFLCTLAVREPLPPPTADPSERASQLHLLDRMLNKLNPKKRTVFVLFEIEGLRVDEIARVVGCPENTVWSRLHHARAEMLKMARRSLA